MRIAVAPAKLRVQPLGESTAPAIASDNSPKMTDHGKPRNAMQRAWDRYEGSMSGAVGTVSAASGRLGAFTARRPWLVIAVSVIASLVICVGFARFRLENESDVLWVPQKGKAVDDKKYVQSNYPQGRQGASFYARLKPEQYQAFNGTDNVLQLSTTWEMFQLHQKVMAIAVTGGNRTYTFTDVCLRSIDNTCDSKSGYLWYWYKDFTYFLNAVQGSATDPRVGNETAFRQQVSSTTYPDGNGVSLLSLFGGTVFGFRPFQLQAAKVIAIDYNMDKAVPNKVAKDWHLAFIDLMKSEMPKQQFITYTFITGSSVGEELGKSITGDFALVIISLLVFIAIALAFLSKFDMVKTRTTLALLGVFLVALGIASGWGWGLIFGMPFTPLQQLSPFILLGMGIDVLFILIKSYEIIVQREPGLSLEASFSKLMSTAGLSVQVTLMASAVAFALGAVDDLNSVKWFSAFASLNTAMILVLMMTAFVGMMVLTERRIKRGRFDFCCCFGRDPEPDVVTGLPVAAPVNGTVQISAFAGAYGHQNTTKMLADDDVKDESWIKVFFRKYYAPFLSIVWVKIFVVLFFVAWATLSWISIYKMKYGQPLADLAPDGSYLQEYDRVQQATYAQQVGEPVGLYFRGIDPSDPAIQYKMLKAYDMALSCPMINASTTAFTSPWLIRFLKFAQDANATVALPNNNCYNPLVGKITGNLVDVITPVVITGCVPQASFYTLFRQWSATRRGNDILLKSDGTIRDSRFTMSQVASMGDDRFFTHLLNAVRPLEKDINKAVFQQENDAAGTYSCFVYGSNYVFAEGDKLLPDQALEYFLLALAGIFVVTTFMLINPIASLLMVVGVGLVILYLFGELFALNIRFNQVSVINMVMATGLAVDYCVYFAQKFMAVHADGTGDQRMIAAMSDTGSAVFLGGLTALCGSVPMAFSKSIIIRTFFKLIFGTILFSLLVGLLLMPVLFSLLRPPPIKSVLVFESEPEHKATQHDAEVGMAPIADK
ncbi:patched [Haematococcus lacustris]